jgi:hypothetical protein
VVVSQLRLLTFDTVDQIEQVRRFHSPALILFGVSSNVKSIYLSIRLSMLRCLILTNVSTADLATSSSVVRPPMYVLCNIDADVSIKNTIIVILSMEHVKKPLKNYIGRCIL